MGGRGKKKEGRKEINMDVENEVGGKKKGGKEEVLMLRL